MTIKNINGSNIKPPAKKSASPLPIPSHVKKDVPKRKPKSY